MRSARDLYRLGVTLALAAAIAVSAAAGVAIAHVDLAPGPVGRLVSYCRQFLLPQLMPGDLVVLGLGALGSIVVIRALRSVARQLHGYRRFLRALEVVGEHDFGTTRVLLVDGAQPQAFCAGLVRPRIYLTLAARELLPGAQLAAVIAHEAHHQSRRDPLRILLLTVLGDALIFLPVLRRLTRRYEELAEIAADEAAVSAAGDPSQLAAALLRFGERGTPGVVGIAAERVDHLLGARPRWELPGTRIAAAFLSVSGVLAAVWLLGHSTGAARTNLVALATQSCMVGMVALPIVALAALTVVGRRTFGARPRQS